jgi:hypothetical protein
MRDHTRPRRRATVVPLRSGRTKPHAPFLILPHRVMDSAAFRSLSTLEFRVLFAIAARHNGHDDIAFGASAAREAGITNYGGRKAIAALVDRGLLIALRPFILWHDRPSDLNPEGVICETARGLSDFRLSFLFYARPAHILNVVLHVI